MTNRTWAGTCGAIVAAASMVVMAQTQPPPTPQQSTASPDQITITGCLRAAPGAAAATSATGTAGATGTTGTASAAPTDADAKFVLTNATQGPAAPPSSESAAGAAAGSAAGTASQASADQGQTYRLVANPASLSPHVGKKLELTGTLVNPSAATSSAAASSPSDAPALRVEKGKVIAASCDEK